MDEKICKLCEKKYIPFHGTQKYCEECRMAKFNVSTPKNYKLSQIRKNSKVAKNNAEARALGMSYGEYKAYQYLKEHKTNE